MCHAWTIFLRGCARSLGAPGVDRVAGEQRTERISPRAQTRGYIDVCPNDRDLGQFLAKFSICERHAL